MLKLAYRGGVILALVLVLAAGMLAAGCSDDEDNNEPTATTQSSSSTTPVSGSITVFAASSLTEAFNEIGDAFSGANPGASVEFNFAGSPALVTQLQEGAAADVLATAAQSNMDTALQNGSVVDAGQVFVRNRLVVIVPSDNPANITSPYDLDQDGLRLVLAAEDVPVGKYARQSIMNMEAQPEGGPGFSDAVLGNIVSNASNVKEVVSAVQLGEADAGIVYVTDVTPDVEADMMTIDIPDNVNVIATYPIAVTTDADATTAQAFIDFVLATQGQQILQSHGFLPAQ
jgi:molybdate transport system substrate-binding protein